MGRPRPRFSPGYFRVGSTSTERPSPRFCARRRGRRGCASPPPRSLGALFRRGRRGRSPRSSRDNGPVRRDALLAGGGPQRSPIFLALVSPADKVVGRAAAGKDRLRLDVGARGDIAPCFAVGPVLLGGEPVQLARRKVGVHAAFVTQGYGEAGVGCAFGQFDHIELRIDRDGRPEQPEDLVDEMAAEVAQEAAGRAGLERYWVVEVHARMHPPEPAEAAVGDDLTQRLDVGVEAAVVEDPEHDALRLCRGVELAGALGATARRACRRSRAARHRWPRAPARAGSAAVS